MTKIEIKSEKVVPFGGIFPVMEQFESLYSKAIDSTLGKRCKHAGFSYSEILRTLMCVFFCGGSCIEDISNHLKQHLSLHPTLTTCSSDTILRAINELTVENTTYTCTKSGKSYDFNTADKVNELLINTLIATGELKSEQEYDLDFDHQFIETEKRDAKRTYKKFTGYSPGVATIGSFVVGIENRDGNANVRFCQASTLKRDFTRLSNAGISINRFRADCGSCSEEIISEVDACCKFFYIRAARDATFYDVIRDLDGWQPAEINGNKLELNQAITKHWNDKEYRLVIQRQKKESGELDLFEGEYTYRAIVTNDFEMGMQEVIEFYNQRGAQERIFDDLNNNFGWKNLPKSYMAQNAVFLVLAALVMNFYHTIIRRMDVKKFGLSLTSRIKAFVFKFVSVAAKWVKTARTHQLNIYTNNFAYERPFNVEPG